jgi:hypothetical protein
MAHVSRWLDGQGLMPEELTEEVADRFPADRRGKYRKFRTRHVYATVVELRHDRHADTLPRPGGVSKLDGLTRFLARLFPAPRDSRAAW